MIALPEHVHKVTARGREYFYFQRNRGTKIEGARHKLPNDPRSSEFWTVYNKLVGKSDGDTFRDLIASYKESPEFKEKSADTRRGYIRYLVMIEKAWGNLAARNVKPKNVLKLRDRFASQPATANGLMRMISALINWGIPRDYRDDNPCVAVPKLKTGEWEPWPDWAVELGREAPAHLVWVMETALFTGQRQRDCLLTQWSDLEDGGILVTQEKTGKKLWIALHPKYKAVLDSIPRTSTYIHTNTKGIPWTQDGFRTSWGKHFEKGTEVKKAGLVFHGLRKTACKNLADAGCTTSEIQAITGMSLQMVEHYSKGADQKRLSKAAILKLEKNTK